MRKRKDKDKKPNLRSILYTSKYFNTGKGSEIKQLLETMSTYKNLLSKYVYENRNFLLTSDGIKTLKANYNIVKDNTILAWNIQKEHHSIVDKYENALRRQMKNFKVRIQDKMIVKRYSRGGKRHKKGETKYFEIKFKSTKLTRLVKYLVYLDFSKDIEPQITNGAVKDLLNYYKTKPYFDRILNLAKDMQNRLLSKIKLIKFDNDYSMRLTSTKGINNARIEIDETNSLYKHWFIFKMKGNKEYRLPLEIKDKYHNKEIIGKEFMLCLSLKKNKINTSTTYEGKEPVFKSFNKAVGMDINIKHNFAKLSDDKEIDYDREFFKKIVKDLNKLDKIGYQNLSEKELKKLQKIYRRLDWYVELLIHNILDYCEKNGITDLVVEDLRLKDKSNIINEEFNMKYSRLVKLLHLSDVKNALLRQGEKRGIRVHIVHSEWTSLGSPECGNIDPSNRTTQEIFKCSECGYEDNADYVGSVNVLERFNLFHWLGVQANKLYSIDEYGRIKPKHINKYALLKILNDYYKVRGFLHHPVLPSNVNSVRTVVKV
uniref:Cas12f1-like TNB domain-containing protein n=1 Tax=Caldisericum exile TaxID=693075 RepID=A0A7C4U0T4_9BACT